MEEKDPVKIFVSKIAELKSGESAETVLTKYDAFFVIEWNIMSFTFEVSYIRFNSISRVAVYRIKATKN